jgi:ferredoxin/flavodoxin
MKMLICYYSNSGNTKLACQYIARNIDTAEVSLFDIKKDEIPNLGDYGIVGFATFTDFLGPSLLVQTFLEKLPEQKNKPAFVFNTYGFVSGKTMKILDAWVTAKGFSVIAGHSLHTPESYPPMVAKGRGHETSPNRREMNGLNSFITGLNGLIGSRLDEGREIDREKIKFGFLGSVLPAYSRTKARDDMGEKSVDEALCDECGICEKGCPYKAIKLYPKPVFDMDRCYGCWFCFNHCPNKAIYTKKFRGVGHYPRPNDHIKAVFSA